VQKRLIYVVFVAGVLLGVGYYLYRTLRPSLARSARVVEWIRKPGAHPDWAVRAGTRCGADAPFIIPTDGFIGYLWDDSFKLGHRHQGIDIFGGMDVGQMPVVAAYPGYLTRLPDWKSSVIVRVPEDPLQPGRQIWLYYTHMADPTGDSFISRPIFRPARMKNTSRPGRGLAIRATTLAIRTTRWAYICTFRSCSTMGRAISAMSWRSAIRSIRRRIWGCR